MKAKKYLISTLIILVIWYLVMSFIQMEFNPAIWSKESRIALIVISICASIGYFVIEELHE